MAAPLLFSAPPRPECSSSRRFLVPFLGALMLLAACGSTSSSVEAGQASEALSSAMGDDAEVLAETSDAVAPTDAPASTTTTANRSESTLASTPATASPSSTEAPATTAATAASVAPTTGPPSSTSDTTTLSPATAVGTSSSTPPATAKATTTSATESTTTSSETTSSDNLSTTATPVPTTAVPTSTTAIPTTVAPTTTIPATTAPAPTSTTAAPTAVASGPLACSATLADHVGQLLLPIVPASQLDGLADAVAAGRVGGIAILGPVDQRLDDRLAALQELAGDRPLLIMVDEEGGRVRRMTSLGPPQEIPAAATQADLPPAELTEMFEDHAVWMRKWGINVDLAPVVDVGGGPAIGTRSFSPSGDPDVVVAGAGSVIDGLTSAGTLAVLKHFPGHGAATADSHKVLPTTPAWDPSGVHVQPFSDLIRRAQDRGQPLSVMVGHLNVPGLTDGLPATLSSNAYRVLRRDLGFDGLVMTDSLDMGAIGISQPDAALRAVTAGADMAMIEGRFVDEAFELLSAAAANSAVLEERVRSAATRVYETKAAVASAPQCPEPAQ